MCGSAPRLNSQGKYVEIQFSRAGQPDGGKVCAPSGRELIVPADIELFAGKISRHTAKRGRTQFPHLLPGKSVPADLDPQLCAGADQTLKPTLGISEPTYYYYLNQSGCVRVEGTDDAADFKETMVTL
jgi:myosin-1